ncbi:hypothetical protein [Paenibacillus sp. D9]|nr:hypothetical protein [Paenibacillus sp. D9]CDN42303.1 hypothetical protein BN871_BC_00330 [Paenibacillus sp. P22]
MEPIRPLHEEHVQRFCGMPVCAILKDGTRHMGILTACHGGRIYLNGGEEHHKRQQQGIGILGKPAKGKAKKSKASKPVQEQVMEQEAHTQAYPYGPGAGPYGPGFYGGRGPYGYGYGAAVGVDLAFLAFLLLLI